MRERARRPAPSQQTSRWRGDGPLAWPPPRGPLSPKQTLTYSLSRLSLIRSSSSMGKGAVLAPRIGARVRNQRAGDAAGGIGSPAPALLPASCPLPLLSVDASPFSRAVPLLFLFFCPLPVWSCVLAPLGSCEAERRPPPCTRHPSPAWEQGFSPRGPPASSGLLRALGAGHRTWRHVRLHAVLRAASAPMFIGISGAFRTRRGNTHCFGSWSKTKRGNVPPRKTGCYSYKRLKNKGL